MAGELKPCEYCGFALPLGVDKKTRQTRSHHFESCEARLARVREVETSARVPIVVLERHFDIRNGESVQIRGEVNVAEVRRVVKRYAEGVLLLEQARREGATTGDHLRLLAFYCDEVEGRG